MPQYRIGEAPKAQYRIGDAPEGQGSTPNYGQDVQVENPSLVDIFKGMGKSAINHLSEMGAARPTGGFYPASLTEPMPQPFRMEPSNFGQRMGAGAESVLEPLVGLPAGLEVGEALPSAARAGRTLEEIRTAAKDVPVLMEKTQEPLQRFEELTQAGGRRSKPFTQIYKRAQDSENPLTFPEARDFYTNMNDATNQTTLQKWMGRGMKPNMRRQGLMAKHALNEDLTNAAEQVGMGDRYTEALREYANAKKMQKIGRIGAGLAAGEAARRTGLLGNWIHRTALQQ